MLELFLIYALLLLLWSAGPMLLRTRPDGGTGDGAAPEPDRPAPAAAAAPEGRDSTPHIAAPAA